LYSYFIIPFFTYTKFINETNAKLTRIPEPG
jgi:hypothetical protein